MVATVTYGSLKNLYALNPLIYGRPCNKIYFNQFRFPELVRHVYNPRKTKAFLVYEM
ncbi:hypothetical protein HanPI659440_Chr07g0269611 [Helianthus annuus]|nr:hypothetical protein HanPI659440_Chr07g0269611 [Helianthus annuus]